MIFSPKPDSHVANPGSVAIFLSVYLTDYELNVSTKFLVSSLELASRREIFVTYLRYLN